MINLEDIIESIEDIIGIPLILHKSMHVHPVFKIYKVFTYNLYTLVDGNKVLLNTMKQKVNVTQDDVNSAWSNCDKLYLRELIKWVINKNYKI